MTRPRPQALPAPVVTRLVPEPQDPARPVVQGTLALHLVPDEPGPLNPGPVTAPPACRTPDVADRELRAWTVRFAQALVEVVGGHRPVGQLVRWTSREVFRDLERRTRLVQLAATTDADALPLRSTALAQVRSVHVSRPAPSVAEVSVHLRQGRRSRALALRLDRQQERWVCTALELS
ncbi:Rv3235 family protein [Nocardioides marmoribigeumensis]|uniref:3-hydroxyacyl-CoA dehydrogenase n=1 Tax=Nocardioides marmoribigeumensis TaxID=433649 RepID=A0ABU2C069_9ACTN|nr:Rv3235 family protein [Nocardioides marmoribigeumensis]MDR7364032.1 hypothetical protein [Nocardioides marmoribigeumensis]